MVVTIHSNNVALVMAATVLPPQQGTSPRVNHRNTLQKRTRTQNS